MTTQQKIWTIQCNDWDEDWHLQGCFSTKENAEAYREVMLKDSDRELKAEDIRIDWEYLDPEYV